VIEKTFKKLKVKRKFCRD